MFFVESLLAGSAEVKPGDNLQAVLNKGEDLVLKQGLVYEISNTLRCKKRGLPGKILTYTQFLIHSLCEFNAVCGYAVTLEVIVAGQIKGLNRARRLVQ